MKSRWLRTVVQLFACVLASSGIAHAQTNASGRSIEFIVPWGPGGGADQLARLLGKKVEAYLGLPITVVNHPGASGNIGMSRLLSGSTDGRTVAVLTGDTLAALASGTASWKLDELTALGVFVRQPSALFVRSDSRLRTWNDVLTVHTADGAKRTVATTGPGSMDEITVNYLNSRGANLVSVPYPKPGERYAAVIGGHVDILYEQAGDIKGHLEANALRPILFFAGKRMPAFADVPVSGEFGYDLALTQFRAVVAKAGSDPARMRRLAAAMERYARSEEFNAYLKEQLASSDSYIPPSQAREFLRSELQAMRRFVSTTRAAY